ncbi:tubulin-tyrosine ligase family-domain-containing protein [Ochromonadaceae sp. CCMP2298]|nr:tubulin-tyrosine ligase family-domain-containing protein [Ochromonadaceae sp. CCMP2298]
MFHLVRTRKFSVAERGLESWRNCYVVDLDLNCDYTLSLVAEIIRSRPWCSTASTSSDKAFRFQIKDFEHIAWEDVMRGSCGASSYLVRKGLARKAQLSLQVRRYCSKHPESILKTAVPYTLILETWNAFEEMKLDFGRGTFASFEDPGITQAPLRQRLDWCLSDARAAFDAEEHLDRMWILKPSATNKGASIAVVLDWEGVLEALEEADHVREWVLQRYIERPLLYGGHKFHLRVYVLCVGGLRVFVFDQILMLLAAHRYVAHDVVDIYAHLTNTARAAEDVNFDERKFVRLLDDLVPQLCKRRDCPTLAAAEQAVAGMRQSIHRITADLFAAYENEYSIFTPMSSCFELYGLDFMVDQSLQVHLLEANPGPDFKQTGDRLSALIGQLWEQSCSIVLDSGLMHPQSRYADGSLSHAQTDAALAAEWAAGAPDFTLAYSKEWSCAKQKGGMTFIE